VPGAVRVSVRFRVGALFYNSSRSVIDVGNTSFIGTNIFNKPPLCIGIAGLFPVSVGRFCKSEGIYGIASEHPRRIRTAKDGGGSTQ